MLFIMIRLRGAQILDGDVHQRRCRVQTSTTVSKTRSTRISWNQQGGVGQHWVGIAVARRLTRLSDSLAVLPRSPSSAVAIDDVCGAPTGAGWKRYVTRCSTADRWCCSGCPTAAIRKV